MQHMPMLRFVIVLLPNSYLGIEPEWEAMDPQKSSSIEKKEEVAKTGQKKIKYVCTI